jgi:ketosteroid isomerase-like protein
MLIRFLETEAAAQNWNWYYFEGRYMNIEDNKKLVSEMLSRFSNSDIPAALETMADDVSWWIAGKADALPASGTYSKVQIAGIFRRMLSQLKDGLRMTVKGMTAEGDRVAVEVESYGELKNGRVYNQEYHMLMVIRDGKISAVREYLDTQHVFAVWFEP